MKIGLVGVGRWGSKVANEYRKLVDENIIDEFLTCDYAEPNVDFNKLNDLLMAVDAVHIAVPHSKHYEVASSSLMAGKHVLLEKPMTETKEEAYSLIELANTQDLILQVGFVLRFANVVKKLRNMFKSDYFGQVYQYDIKWTMWRDPIPGVDIVWDLLPHPLDLLYYFTGAYPEYVTKHVTSFRRNYNAEIAFIVLKYNSVPVNIELSWLNRNREQSIRIHGKDRSVWAECVKQKIIVNQKVDKIEDTFEIEIEQNPTVPDEILNFVNSIKSGKNLINSHIIGLRNTEFIENIMKIK